VIRGVVFDLWNTLARWREDESTDFRRRWSERIGVTPEALDEVWHASGAYERRESGPIAAALTSVLEAFDIEGDVSEAIEWRVDIARRALVPEPGAVETLEDLRRRGTRTGLISNCTEEVALVWPETPFAGLLDTAVFSATAGCMKPDREIYELALAQLDVPASETLFVGDGANDELRGARDVGMTPVLADLDGIEPWAPVEDWTGLRVTAIPQVLDLLERL
jgi:putative hydrolase of the HAD superfamily